MLRLTRKHLCIPYLLFLVLFVVTPVLVILYYAFTNGQGQFSAANLIGFFTSGNTMGTLIYSAFVAVIVTLACLVIAYPVAYILYKMPIARGRVLLILFVIPMWINFTLRITALKEVLSFIEGNLAYYPLLNTIIGQTYDFLPFMILPIYTTLIKLEKSYREAAADLGASHLQVFFTITLPLSMPGVISGIMMVFLPSMTNYVILDMLYNSTYIMGSLIGSYFSAYNWNKGSMISMVLLGIICLASLITGKFTDSDDVTDRGGALL